MMTMIMVVGVMEVVGISEAICSSFISKVDESDEEGRTGLIHATLEGKVRFFATSCFLHHNYSHAGDFCQHQYHCHVKRGSNDSNQENMVEVLLDGSADIEVCFHFSGFAPS